MKAYDWSNKNLRVVEWISCKERMPEEYARVYVRRAEDHIDGYYSEDKIMEYSRDCWSEGDQAYNVSDDDWWMELPEGPR